MSNPFAVSDEASELDISFKPTQICILVLLALRIGLLSVANASISILRLNPRKISLNLQSNEEVYLCYELKILVFSIKMPKIIYLKMYH